MVWVDNDRSSGRTPSDRRRCWVCDKQIVFRELDDIREVDKRARANGWRYVHPGDSWRAGEMLCPSCHDARSR